MRRFAIAALIASLAAPLAAQPAPPPAASRQAGKELAFLVGQWSGEGWIQMGRDRNSFRQTERVAPMLEGAILTVEGKGVDPTDPKTVYHHAFAVLSWNEAESRYDFRSYAMGRAGTFPARLEAPGKLVWEIEAPGSRIRYTISVSGDRWREDGEVKLGDADWRPFFHMELKRTAEAGS